MGKIIETIERRQRQRDWDKKMQQSQLSFKGTHFYNYIKELLEGKEVFIQHYEDDIEGLSTKSGVPREKLLPFIAAILAEIETKGVPRE